MSPKPGKAPIAGPDRRHRRFARYRCEFSVAVSVFAGKAYRELEAHCKDLSEAGIGVLLASELAPGEVVSLNFTLPEQPEPWDVRAVLRHRRGYHYGFEFLSLSRERSDTLKTYFKILERAD
jgi:hypothetical protein